MSSLYAPHHHKQCLIFEIQYCLHFSVFPARKRRKEAVFIMKRIFILLFLFILVTTPQSVNALYDLTINTSFEPTTTYVSKGDIFSVTYNIMDIDYSELETIYPFGYSVCWQITGAMVKYDVNILYLLSVNGKPVLYDDVNTGEYQYFFMGDGVYIPDDWTQSSDNSYILNFKALQNGHTELLGEAFATEGDLGYFDPDSVTPDHNGWHVSWGAVWAEGFTTGHVNVPEPSTMLLLGIGLVGLGGIRRKFSK